MPIYPKLIAALPLENYRLLLQFDGGELRLYDFTPHLNHKYYQSLGEPSLFRRVAVEDGDLLWATGQDFCPHTLYEDSVTPEDIAAHQEAMEAWRNGETVPLESCG